MAALSAQQVMTAEVETVADSTTISELIDLLKDKHYSGFPVVDSNGSAVGLVSQNDVLRSLACVVGSQELAERLQSGRRKASLFLVEAMADDVGVELAWMLGRPVRDIMSPRLIACTPDTPVKQVCGMMTENRVHRVVVCDGGGAVLGMIAATDLVRCLGELL